MELNNNNDDIAYHLAVDFFELIKKKNSAIQKPDFNQWADEFKKMMERDAHTEIQIRKVMEWSQQLEVFKDYVVSPRELRILFYRIILHMKRQQFKNQFSIDSLF